MTRSKSFIFDGGAANYVGTGILAYFITFFTFGVGFPWALCLFKNGKQSTPILMVKD